MSGDTRKEVSFRPVDTMRVPVETIPSHRASVMESVRDPTVLPDQFIVGRSAVTLISEGPTDVQVEEFEQVYQTSEWGIHVSRLLKWAKGDEAGRLVGNDDVAIFRRWECHTTCFFAVWGVENVMLQAQLATLTFSGTAALWWEAYKRVRPRLRVSFCQLLECLQRELVPSSLPSVSHLAW